MRKIWVLAFTCCFLMSGCSALTADVGNSTALSDTLEEGQYEIYGKVRSIFGNELLLVIGVLPQQTFPTMEEAGETPAENGQPLQETGDSTMEFPAVTGEGTSGHPGGDMPSVSGSGTTETIPDGNDSGGMGGASGGTGSGSSGMGGVSGGTGNGSGGMGGGMQQAELTLEYTGEEQTFLIPVTATVTSGQGERATTARFTQIAEKNILRLVLDENDQIVSVQILS